VKDESVASGCAFALIAFNLLVMGLVAFSFTQGPYSSDVQEYWYRYGSLGFMFVGAILPGILLKLYGRQCAFTNQAVVAWELIALLAFFSYLFLSGGGV
jgi:hypothetical protein